MNLAALAGPVAGIAIAGKCAMQLWLEAINARNVRANAGVMPESFREFVDEPTYRKSISYTLAKSTFERFEIVWNTAILLIVLFSGILPASFRWFQSVAGESVWSLAAYLFAIGVVLAIPGLPMDWYSQFRLEERFGFNTTTQKTWWLDRLKGLFLAGALGYPLLVLILKLVQWTGSHWWLWTWICLCCFQVVMMVLAPMLILPLFNKFTPLPEGALRERLLALGRKTGFTAKNIQLMDGSKRSRHSNAFFTGLGKYRRIVLFDTLVQQLTEGELEAVLAHEIGHYKRRHVPKMILVSVLSLLLGLYVISYLSRQPWFYQAFGFAPGNIVPALLLFALLSGAISFWFSPLINRFSRRYEYEADSYAAQVMAESKSLIHALRKLNEKNLSNLTPHPIYSAFYYSHPTLLEREGSLSGKTRG